MLMTNLERREVVAKGRSTETNTILRSRVNFFHTTVWSLMVATTFFQYNTLALQPPPQSAKEIPTVRGLTIHRVPLRRQQQIHREDESSPYCFALSSMLDLPTQSNILATQVWPSARVAAMTLEERILTNGSKFCSPIDARAEVERKNRFTICEVGCGPGLPSLTAAAVAAASLTEKIDFQVIATDVDDFALDLVKAAAKEQDLERIVSTRRLDLIQCGKEEWMEEDNKWLDDVDLFVMSDVFESNAVAVGAARFVKRVLCWGENGVMKKKNEMHLKRKRVWVFAQTDRTQREVFLEELQELSIELPQNVKDDSDSSSQQLKWTTSEYYDLEDRLWLCDVDETVVNYG